MGRDALGAGRVWIGFFVVCGVIIASLMVVSPPATAAFGGNCSGTSTGETPLSDQGIDGILYGSGNTMPAEHVSAAPGIAPIDGVVGVASLGMSNADREWQAFMDAVAGHPAISPALRFANGALGGTPMEDWADPDSMAWSTTLSAMAADGISAQQVQVVWMKMGSQLGQLEGDFDQRVQQERTWLNSVLENAADVFPNLQRVYMSSRIYAGYGDNPNHTEPLTGYDNGFSVKATVADAIAGTTPVWAAWGPYLWADGLNPRSDGLVWECGDFAVDGIHPSKLGEDKVANMIFDFFSSDTTACAWFLQDTDQCGEVALPDAGPFADVSWGDTFADDIAWLAETEITLGCNPPDNTLFCPRDFVTRGEMAAFLVRALDLPPGTEKFGDDDGSIFEQEIEALAAAEITLGCNPPANSNFCPDAFVTRGEMAAFLVRALDLPPGPERFVDDDGALFEAEINALAQADITLGCNPPLNSLYCPTDSVTREQMAAFLHRAAIFFP